tara:strand:+ start:254 stop:2167 length:1914 start_codon:yes stop_codon:yes gene_type:complete
MELLRDKKVEEQFHTLVKKFLTKNENYDTSRFIGGMPITLERGDVSSLLYKNTYSVTQKVDGTRVLMYIGYNNTTSGIKQRTVCFVDRNMKIYTIRDSTRSILPYINTPEMLLDGELVFFDKDGISHKELDSRLVKGVSFMTFDILFGPEDISIASTGEKIIGQSFSMTVPYDGKLKSYAWKYINRYDILYKMIIPGSFNKNDPILTSAFKDTNWFNIELKPIYFLNTLKDHRVLYNDSKTGYLQTLLSTGRRDFYTNVLQKMYNKQINTFISKTVKLDGLIFTSSDTLYTIGTWNTFLTTQYKWKPVSEQSVDFLMKRSGANVALFTMIRGNITPFQQNYKNVLVPVPTQDFRDNSIGEFTINDSGQFIFKEYRTDKKEPNALRTVLNVINSFKNPVNINDLYYFLNLSPNSKQSEIKKVLEYSSKTKLLQCIVKSTNIDILDAETYNTFIEMINASFQNKDIELELRLGKIQNFFNPNIQQDIFDGIISKLDSFKYPKITETFVDVYSDKIRTRYIYSEDFQAYILLESIVKNRISKLDINMSEVLNYDIRIAMSNETKIKEYNLEGDSYKKYRISYTEPNGTFRVDLTTITSGSYKSRQFLENDDPKKTLQVEIEILKQNVEPKNVLKFLSYLL